MNSAIDLSLTYEELTKKSNPIILDVRTLSEYKKGTIPGAINLPLFDEAERSELGIIYKMAGSSEAKIRGLEIVAPKLSSLVEKLQPYYKRELILFCWRGGLRSQSLTNVLNLLGFRAFYLTGGYKAYRRFVVSYLDNYPYEKKLFVVLDGLTGVGKTDVICALRSLGEPAIDLEDLACHRGSAFGHIGLPQDRSQKVFDTLLTQELQNFSQQDYLIVECESQRIGNLFLPAGFFQAMQGAHKILLYDSLKRRILRLASTYLASGFNEDTLKSSVDLIQNRLGKQKSQKLKIYLEEKNYYEAIELLLRDYYDPLYRFPEGPSPCYRLCIQVIDPMKVALDIKKYLISLH